jgi:transketolase
MTSSMDELKGFSLDSLSNEHLKLFFELANQTRLDLLTALHHSGTGHPGGSLSSLDLYLMLWLCANVYPGRLADARRDRIVVSHGHTAAGVYAVLGNLGYFPKDEFICSFRKDGSRFEGHPSLEVPGVEWCSGSLGQGLSVACGMALAAKMKQADYRVFVVMGDGEQAKGQLQEAREFAVKYHLDNLIAIVDCNGLQASGRIEDIIPQNISLKYSAAGWRVLRINGHDASSIYCALQTSCVRSETPTVILAETVMGKGVSAIENNYEYHGKALSKIQYDHACLELSCTKSYSALSSIEKDCGENTKAALPVEYQVNCGKAVFYNAGQLIDCRTAFGEAMLELAEANKLNDAVVIAALDCDLAESVKLQEFGRLFPDNFIECGIQEHNAVTVAGALSRSGILTFFSDFGVFGIDETYGQHRMNDFNKTSVKLVCTHCGLDVGEDGKTHQCVDYLGLLTNLHHFQVIIPADANQTGHAFRYMATHAGNIALLMGRSKVPVLSNENGALCFGSDYHFEYGQADWIRNGRDGTIITYGNMVSRAVDAHDRLQELGSSIGVLNITCPCELDVASIRRAANIGLVVVYEDHNKKTGLGSQIGALLAEYGADCRFRRLGIEKYGFSASPQEQYRLQGLAVEDLVDLIKNELGIKD